MAVAESAGSGARASRVLAPWASCLTLLSLFSVNNTMCSLGMFHIEDQMTLVHTPSKQVSYLQRIEIIFTSACHYNRINILSIVSLFYFMLPHRYFELNK